MDKSPVGILIFLCYLCSVTFGELCEISTREESSSYCRKIRDESLKMEQVFYKLTREISNPGPADAPMPLLDQPLNATFKHFLTDKFDAHCFNIQFIVLYKMLDGISQAALKHFATQNFTTFHEYNNVARFFKKSLGLHDKEKQKYFKDPSISYPFMKDFTKNDHFLSDEYFVETFLAGSSVMVLRRITRRGKIGTNWNVLKQRLNPKFNWGKAIHSVTKRGCWQSIIGRMVYVAEFPLLTGLKNLPNILPRKYPPGVKMIPQTNPIAIFASRYNPKKRKYELKPVAIQIDDTQAAKVYAPCDGFHWQVAKAIFQVSSMYYTQVHEHLLRTHFRMEPICVVLKRQLSKFHPLHELLKYHCRGLVAVNANGLKALNSPGGFLNQLFGYGHDGSLKLMQRGYEKMVWNDIGLENNIEERGMNDKKKVPFYPYRDDGIVVDRVIKKFARSFVDIYYGADEDVQQDSELQSFINELSINGRRPPNNGTGRVKGLPSHFTTKFQVAKFLSEVLWIQVHHALMTYPPLVFESTMALSPSKLYADSRGYKEKNLAYMLSGPQAAIIQSRLAASIGTVHYDSLFDYGEELRDEPMKRLVARTYRELMEKVKPLLDRRNERRLKRGQATYPFIVPGWVPNSITT
ncbi:polyunsaturated fatty acid 5-lipoxygenase-like isoform X1 [Rhopilema esculentum]|uniref:polyunsaturated fatty acid 5-lipoxygenase-like isoform X1 n=2 Tax=Rhopilema esculentum TaxID=499914 RepID=UPI0031DFB958